MTRTIILSALLAMPFSGMAANMAVSPVIIRADTTERVVVVNLTNKAATEATFQLEVESWVQNDSGESIRQPTADLISAPIVKVAPGAKRAVRIARQGTGPAQYIITLREILPPRKEGESGVRFPSVFRLPAIFEDKAGGVELTAVSTSDGLLISNAGSLAGHITSAAPEGGEPWKTGHLGWVLPQGNTTLPYSYTGTSVELVVNGEPVVVQVR